MKLGAITHNQISRNAIFWNKKCLLTLLFVVLNVPLINAQAEDSIVFSFSELNYGNLLVGDYDNDSDYDVLLSSAFWEPVSDVLIDNQGGEFEPVDLLLEDLSNRGRGQAWGDIDNDNDLDLIISGANQENLPVSKIYRNDGGGIYRDIHASIEAISESAVGFGDLDNDGDQDLIISGLRIDGHPIARIYMNIDHGVFVETDVFIEGLSAGSILICDLDSDMDNDVVINGYDVHKKSKTVILRNDHGMNFTLLDGQLPDIGWGMWSAADLNSDGRLDLVAADAAYNYLVVSINVVDFIFEHDQVHFSGEEICRLDLGDFDNDSDIDIALPSGPILENRGVAYPFDQFLEVDRFPMSEDPGDVAWFTWFKGHMNDLVFSSSIQNGAVLYSGDSASSLPGEPHNLTSRIFNGTTLLSWSRPAGSTATMGITYNLRVGSTPGGCEILSPMSDSMGFHKIMDFGNCLKSTSWELKNLAPGEYYWSVQTINRNHIGSSFAEEQSFTIQADYCVLDLEGDSITALGNLSPFDMDKDGIYDLFCTADVHLTEDSVQREYGIMTKQEDSTYVFKNLDVLHDNYQIEAFAFNDFDQDGYVDMAISLVQDKDSLDSDYLFKILRNSGGEELMEYHTDSISIAVSDIQWLDYDRDGDSDFCLTAALPDSSGVIELYKQDISNTFSLLQRIEFLNIVRLRTSMHDFDADGKMDLIVMGDSLIGLDDNQCYPVIKFFQLGVKGWTESSELDMPLLDNHLDVSDLNNDGFLDLISYGSRNEYKYGLDFYENENGQGFKQLENNLKGVNLFGHVGVGDHNLDMQSDIYVLDEALAVSNYNLKVYEREGFTYNEKSIYLEEELPYVPSLTESSFSLADLDGDSDLDIILRGKKEGQSYSRFILQNVQSDLPSTMPVPKNLKHSRKRSNVVLSWEPVEGNACYYNVRVGTSPGGIDIVAPQSDPETGSLQYPNLGNAGCNNQFLLDSLPDGTYYWSVQAISKNRTGGNWATEKVFGIMGELELDFDIEGNCANDSVYFINKSSGPVNNWSWDFGDGGKSTLENPSHSYAQAREYIISLTAGVGAYSYTHSKSVKIARGFEVDFDYEVVSVHRDVPFTNLTDTIGIGTTSWLWDFGDNSTYSGFDPGTHYYEKPTTYVVTLSAFSVSGCADSISKVVPMCESLPDKPELFVGGDVVWYLACSPANHYQWYYNGEALFDGKESVYVPGDKMGDYFVKISNDNSCWVSSDVVTIPTDDAEIESLNALDQVEIYPNPSKGTINLQMQNALYGKVSVEIYTIHGSKVFDQTFYKETDFFSEQIEFNTLAPGIYFISMRVGDHLMEERLLIN